MRPHPLTGPRLTIFCSVSTLFSCMAAAVDHGNLDAFMRAVFEDDTETLNVIMKRADKARESGDDPYAPNSRDGVSMMLIHGNTPEDVALLWRVREILDNFERENTPRLHPSDAGLCSNMTKDFVLRYDPRKSIRDNAVHLLKALARGLFFTWHEEWDKPDPFSLRNKHLALVGDSIDEMETWSPANNTIVCYWDIIQPAIRAARAILDL